MPELYVHSGPASPSSFACSQNVNLVSEGFPGSLTNRISKIFTAIDVVPPEQNSQSVLTAAADSARTAQPCVIISDTLNSAVSALQLSAWRSIVGLPGIRRVITAALWSPAVYVYRSATSAASALSPFFWVSKLSVPQLDPPGYCTSVHTPNPSDACSTGSEQDPNSGGDTLAAVASQEARTTPLACIRCPHCSGVFRWEDAEHVVEGDVSDFSVKRSSSLRTPEQEEVSPAPSNAMATVDECPVQLARKSSSVPLPSAWSRSNRSTLQPPREPSCRSQGGGSNSSDGRSARDLALTRQPRWIRFLARRLRCIHVRDSRRIIEARQNGQGQSADRRRHLRLRHRKQLANETQKHKDWQLASDTGVPVVSANVEDEHNCTKGGPSGNSMEVDNEFLPYVHSKSHFPSREELSGGTPRSSSVTAGNDAASDGSAKSSSVPATYPCYSSAAALHATRDAPAASIKQTKGVMDAELLPAVPTPHIDQRLADPEAVVPCSSEVAVWPLISLKSMEFADLRDAFNKLEEQRLRFNALQRRGGSTWNRRREMQQLANLLVNTSVPFMSVLDSAMLCVHSNDGLQVWKGESGVGSFGCRATFLLPVEPRLYAMFASSGTLRCQWDKNVTEQHVVEELDAGQDICYVAFRRIATVYPRDIVTLRVKCRLFVEPRVAQPSKEANGASANELKVESEEDTTAYSSMSCSIDHPDVPESSGRVRMNVRVNAYIAKPVHTPFGLWSEVTLVSESDPGGWIPATITRHFSAKLLPSTLEKFASQIMKHYNITWTGSAVGFADRMLKTNKLVLS